MFVIEFIQWLPSGRPTHVELNAYLPPKGRSNEMFSSCLRLCKSPSFYLLEVRPWQCTTSKCHHHSTHTLLEHTDIIVTPSPHYPFLPQENLPKHQDRSTHRLIENTDWWRHFIYWFCKPQGHTSQLQRGSHPSSFYSSPKCQNNNNNKWHVICHCSTAMTCSHARGSCPLWRL